MADEFEKIGDEHHREIAISLEKLAHRITDLETLVRLDHDLLQRVIEKLGLERPPR